MTDKYIMRVYPTGTGDFAPDAVLTPEQERARAAAERSLEASFLNTVYETRRARGLSDNDPGMGRLAEAETRNWRHHG